MKSRVASVELVRALVVRDIKTRYVSLPLGVVHVLVVSGLSMLVLSFALGSAMRVHLSVPYPMFVLSGLIPWQFVSQSVSQSAEAFRQSSSIIKKVPFPRALVPISVVITNGLNMLIAVLVALPMFVFFWGATPSWSWLLLPPLLGALLIMVSGVAILVATLGTFFADVKPGVDLAIMLAFYGTPILYPPAVVPESARFLVELSPLAQLLSAARTILFQGGLPSANSLAIIALYTVLLGTVGYITARTYQGRIADTV